MKNYVVSFNLGQYANVIFHASLSSQDDAQRLDFVRVRPNGLLAKQDTMCLVTVDRIKKRVCLIYDSLQVFADIQKTVQVDGNYYFKCTTDLGMVEVFACDPDMWFEKGKTIFQPEV